MTIRLFVFSIIVTAAILVVVAGCDSRVRGADSILERDTASLVIHPKWLDGKVTIFGDRVAGEEQDGTVLTPPQFEVLMAVWQRAREPGHLPLDGVCEDCPESVTTEPLVLVYRDSANSAIGHRAVRFFGAPYRAGFHSEVMPPARPGEIRTGETILSVEEIEVLMPFLRQATVGGTTPPLERLMRREADIWADTRCVLETCPDLIPGGHEVDPADVSPTADHYVPDWDSYLKATGRK